jgi:hypothetical protein
MARMVGRLERCQRPNPTQRFIYSAFQIVVVQGPVYIYGGGGGAHSRQHTACAGPTRTVFSACSADPGSHTLHLRLGVMQRAREDAHAQAHTQAHAQPQAHTHTDAGVEPG